MKPLTKHLVISAIFICGLNSCWFPCAPAIHGTVSENSTETPLDSVKIDLYEGNNFVQTAYSDTLGHFSLNLDNESVFMTKKCERDFKLILTKDGFDENQYSGSAPDVDIRINL